MMNNTEDTNSKMMLLESDNELIYQRKEKHRMFLALMMFVLIGSFMQLIINVYENDNESTFIYTLLFIFSLVLVIGLSSVYFITTMKICNDGLIIPYRPFSHIISKTEYFISLDAIKRLRIVNNNHSNCYLEIIYSRKRIVKKISIDNEVIGIGFINDLIELMKNEPRWEKKLYVSEYRDVTI